MLTINSISVSYGKKNVLNNLSLNLERNKIHGLVGLNGSGKTTLFHAIYGLLNNNNGSIQMDEEAIKREDIGYLETDNYFYSNLSGREHLSLFDSRNPKFNIKLWEELFKIPLDELIENYSSGMKKKLAILSVLKRDKSILLLDEPFNEIDLEASRILKILLESLKEKGKTIIISSHILETLTNTCDYIHHLDKKCIVKSYSKEEFDLIEQNIFSELESRAKLKIEKALE